ncbi:conserved hypothetical protein, partial [Ricinus communis]
MASTISHNVANFVTLRLTPENYPLYQEQLLALAESKDMIGLLTGEKIKPAMYHWHLILWSLELNMVSTNSIHIMLSSLN